MTENETLMEIVHLASAALVEDVTKVKRQALADIYDAIASILPVERVSSASADVKSSETKRVVEIETPREPEAGELTGLSKFLTVAPGVTLVRFAGKDEIKLVARRVGSAGNPNTIFEIDVDKGSRTAYVFRDDRILFKLEGVTCNYSMIEKFAVSALNRWFKNQRKHNSKRRRAAKQREGILTFDQELADTIARQKGEL